MKLSVLTGDITTFRGDAIVNAANPGLRRGRGVSGAVFHAAGAEMAAVCRQVIRKRGRLSTGEAVLTASDSLPWRYVIHAVGPRWFFGFCAVRQDTLLAQTYRSCLQLAQSAGIREIAFPCISTGHYGYPVARAAAIAVATVLEYPVHDDTAVTFFCSDPQVAMLYRRLIER